MKKQGEGSVIPLTRPEERAAEPEGERAFVELVGGRSLAATDGRILELRSPDGQLELKIEITDRGPVLQAEAVRLSVRADELALEGRKSVALESGGALSVSSRGEAKIESTEADVRVEGKNIHLN